MSPSVTLSRLATLHWRLLLHPLAKPEENGGRGLRRELRSPVLSDELIKAGAYLSAMHATVAVGEVRQCRDEGSFNGESLSFRGQSMSHDVHRWLSTEVPDLVNALLRRRHRTRVDRLPKLLIAEVMERSCSLSLADVEDLASLFRRVDEEVDEMAELCAHVVGHRRCLNIRSAASGHFRLLFMCIHTMMSRARSVVMVLPRGVLYLPARSSRSATVSLSLSS
jgi:hypothetical protein